MRTLPRFVFVILIFALMGLGVIAQDDGFTVQATADDQPVIEALAGDMAMTFVDDGADLLVTADPGMDGEIVYILPELALVLQTENEAARAFMDRAVSPDGQEALITAGYLPDSVTVTDQLGNEVTIPQPVRKSVSLYSLVTYDLYTVGAAETLVASLFLGARDPLGAAAMERIDPRFPELSAYEFRDDGNNAEVIASLEPDLIIASPRDEWLGPVKELGIPILRFEGETPDALKESLQIVGQVFGPNAAYRAQLWIDYYDSVLAAIDEQSPDLEIRPQVLFTGTEPTRVASGEMYQSTMIELAGGESVSADLTGFWNDVNLEQVIVWNPEVIFVPPYGGASVEAITDNAEWQLLDSVQNGNVYRVPKLVAPWDTPTTDSVLGIIWMAKVLFPDDIELDCAEEAVYYYNTFYDYAISDEEVDTICSY